MKLIFKSLINNNACVEGGRKRKWWISLLILIFSTIVLCIPTLVKGLTTKGDSVFASSHYGLDHAFVEFFEDRTENNIKMIVNEDGKDKYLTVSNNWTNFEYEYNEQKILKVVYSTNVTNEMVSDLVGDGKTSVIIFTERDVFVAINHPTKGNLVASRIDQNAYRDFSNGNLIEMYYNNEMSEEDVFNSVRDIFTKTNNYRRIVDAWVSVALLAGISIIVVSLMGLMIFVLTRGKRNAYRYFKFFECQRISCWATLSPAILAMLLGFIAGGGSSLNIWFVMFFGIRVMWLSMKSLRPDGTGYPIDPNDIKTVDVKPAK